MDDKNIDDGDGDDDDDEVINVKSERFNPLEALYSKRLIVPLPSAPTLDNVAKANAYLSKNLSLDTKAGYVSIFV